MRGKLTSIITIAAILVTAAIGTTGMSVAGAATDEAPGVATPSAPTATPGAKEAQAPAGPLAPVGSGFTYQGRLSSFGGDANGQFDFTFKLWDAASGGTQAGSTVTTLNQAVIDGLFTVNLDFGPAAFQGSARWLEIAVRPAGAGAYTTLSPRQALSPAPYAMSLMPGAVVTGTVPTVILAAINNGSGTGVQGRSDGEFGVYGESYSSNSAHAGVYGYNGGMGPGVYGLGVIGVHGKSTNGYGVQGTSTGNHGVVGMSTYATGVYGRSTSGAGAGGISDTASGVEGSSTSGTGVSGYSISGTGVFGMTSSNSSAQAGVQGRSTAANGNGVIGEANSGIAAYGVWGKSTSGWAGYFSGNVNVTGQCCGAAEGTFRIDHPLDPANKYLNMAAVASQELLDIYRGHVTLDGKGAALVALPSWFETVNRDFDYKLTAVGAPAPDLHIAQEIDGNRFKIAGGKPGLKVSWQVTGTRHEPYATAHPVTVEQDKPANERGYYLHPELYGQPDSRQMDNARTGTQSPPASTPDSK